MSNVETMVKKVKEPPDKKGVNCCTVKPPYRTIQTSLKSILKDITINEKIQELVLKCNTIVSDAYMFVRLFALSKYHSKQPTPDLNADFLRYCIMAMGTRDARGRSVGNVELLQELHAFYEKEYQPIHNHQKHNLIGLTYTLPYLCQTMETCITTNLKEHFCKRLLRFINIFGGEYYIQNYGEINLKETLWKLKRAILLQNQDIPEQMKPWYEVHKPFLIPLNIEKSIPYDAQKSPFKYLYPSFYMNKQYEEYNEIIQQRIHTEALSPEETKHLQAKFIALFQPLSLRNSSIPKYITIDTATLINLFSEKGTKGKLLQTLKENQETVWKKYFRMNKKLFRKTNDYSFNYTLQTDGIGCSLLFVHRNAKDKKYGVRLDSIIESIPYIDDVSEEQLDILKQKKIVTADPGRKYLMYMMDDEGKSLRYSCMQRDTESLAKRNRRILNTNKHVSDIVKKESLLSQFCCKTVDIERFKAFIQSKYETSQTTKSFYENPLYRKLNWRKKVYRKKSEDKFLNAIEHAFGDKEDIVLCIGDWSNKNTIKGLAPSMGVGLKKIIKKRFTTLLLDEYNTSKKCCNCWGNVCNATIQGNSKFRLLSCKNCCKNTTGSPEDEHSSVVSQGNFLTRDKNSCINMLNIVKYMLYNKKQRPLEFQRCNTLPSPSG